MLRHYVCAALALLLLAGLAPAEKKKPVLPRMTVGKIKKIDVKKGVSILTVKKDDEEKEIKIKIDEDTKFVTFGKSGLKEMSSEDAADADGYKPGTLVQVVKGPDGQLRVLNMPMFKFPRPELPGAGNIGKIKKIDADKGTITVTVTQKGKSQDKDFQVEKDTMIMVFTAKSPPKTFKGKAGLKADYFKPGAMVGFHLNEDGHLKGIMAMGSFKIPTEPFGLDFTMGTVKDIDADNNLLTVTTQDKGKPKDLELKITKTTRFMVMGGKGKPPKVLMGKAGLTAKEFKKGTSVRLHKDPQGKLMMVMALNITKPDPDDDPVVPVKPSKTKVRSGKIKKVDAEKSALTITVTEDDEETDVVVKVSEKTKFISGPKDNKKELVGTRGLKEGAFKVGTEVTAVVKADGTAKTITAKPAKGKLED